MLGRKRYFRDNNHESFFLQEWNRILTSQPYDQYVDWTRLLWSKKGGTEGSRTW